MNLMIIYRATNTSNGKIYIGQTVESLKKRIGRHLYESREGGLSTPFYRALRLYGREAFTWEIVDEAASRKELSEKECLWIERCNSLKPSGYNLTKGGEGSVGFRHSIESRAKITETKRRNARR